MTPATNLDVARQLERVAELLEAASENPWRIDAYRRAASVVRALERPLGELVAERGAAALREHGVGQSLGALLEEAVETGRLRLLERLEAELPPVARLTRVPGIGPGLAQRIHDELHVETLEELELAAHDGSLERVAGIGPRRAELVRQALAGLLGRRRPVPGRLAEAVPVPPVAVLLEVDQEYRRRASAGELVRIAPRRFNPDHQRWLPVLHTERAGLRFTALFSNTPRAHRLGTTADWVVLYWGQDHAERQCTVVTETRGPLAGRRVVRGREPECARWYATAAAEAALQA